MRLSLLRHWPPPLLPPLSHLHTVPSPQPTPSLTSKILQDPNPTPPESPAESLIQDELMNEFLSRFVHSLRPKLVEAFPDLARQVLDEMLLLICQKVVHKLDGSGAVTDDPAVELSDDLSKTIWEISNFVHEALRRDKIREESKEYLHCDEVMYLKRREPIRFRYFCNFWSYRGFVFMKDY